MLLLLAVSLVWAFSFGLIKGRLTGLDATAVAVVRLGFALLVFLPFLRLPRISARRALQFAAIGAVQFGAMYVFYLRSFSYLQAHEVALFTILTPIYLTLIDAAETRALNARHLIASVLAVAGTTLVMAGASARSELVTGFLLVQASNVCFAAGQLFYRRLRRGDSATPDREHFALLYLGAVIATGLFSLASTPWAAFSPTGTQWGVLAYLGILASGLCFFGWNVGALKVNTGTLAVFNNAKVPLGVACSLIFFGEAASIPRVVASLAVLTIAVVIAERRPSGSSRGS